MRKRPPHPAAVPGYAMANRPPPEALGVAPAAALRLNVGLFILAVVCMAVTSSLDNLRGPMLPLLAERLSLSYTAAASFIAAVSLGALFMMATSMRLLVAWPQRRFLALAAAFQLAAALGAAWAPSFAVLLAAGLLWGAGNAGLGLSANLFAIAAAPAAVRGRVMSALHVCYGTFAVLPALYLPRAAGAWPFAAALLAPFALLAAPVALAYSRPKEVRPHEEAGSTGGERFGADAWLLIGGLCIYVLGEVSLSTWAVTYLVARGHSLTSAGGVLAGFFAALAGGRLLLVMFLRPSWERLLPIAGIAGAAALSAAALGGWDWALAGVGLAAAPVFPLLASVLVADYPRRYRGLLSLNYTVMMLLLLAGHQGFGWLSDACGVRAAYHLPLFCFIAAGLCLAARELRRRVSVH